MRNRWVFVPMLAAVLLLGLVLMACSPAAAPATLPPSPATSAPSAPTAAPKPAAGEIQIGALYDLTGGTADVGKDYSLGIQEAIHYVNDQGGVNGKKIVLHGYDYGYDKARAATLYAQMKDQDKVIAVLGWGTGDTDALRATVAADKMPYVSASYSADLTDPKVARFNFFNSSDYSTNARAALTAWYDEVWKKADRFKERRDKGDKPRLMTFYQLAHPYASAPIKALKEHATMLGFEVGPDQNVALNALEATSQVLAAKDFKPDVAWHGNTTASVAVTIRDSVDNGLTADWIINPWGFDENLIDLLGPKGEKVMVAGVAPCSFYGADVPNMDLVKKYAASDHPNEKKRLIRTVQAWGNVLLLWEALKRADKAGSLAGESILTNGFETIKDFNAGLGFAPVSYSPTDHRPSHAPNVFFIKGGTFSLLEKVDVQQRWPDKWDSWHGY